MAPLRSASYLAEMMRLCSSLANPPEESHNYETVDCDMLAYFNVLLGIRRSGIR